MRNDLDTLDFLFHEVAMAEAEHGVSTPKERKQERDILAVVRRSTAAARRKMLLEQEQTPEPMTLGRMPAKLMAMVRATLVDRIAALVERDPGAVQYAFQDLSVLSDNDLRMLVRTLEYPLHEDEVS